MRAGRGEPGRAEANQHGDLGERLDVREQGALAGGVFAPAGGKRRAAADGADERARLATNKATLYDLHLDLPRVGTFLDRALDGRGGGVVMHGHHDLGGVDRGRHRERAVEHQVRSAAQQGAVFLAGRFALAAVDDDHALGAGQCPQLGRERERRPAATGQPAGVEQAQQVCEVGGGQRSVRGQVGGQVERREPVEPGEQPRRTDRPDLVGGRAVDGVRSAAGPS